MLVKAVTNDNFYFKSLYELEDLKKIQQILNKFKQYNAMNSLELYGLYVKQSANLFCKYHRSL